MAKVFCDGCGRYSFVWGKQCLVWMLRAELGGNDGEWVLEKMNETTHLRVLTLVLVAEILAVQTCVEG